MSKSRSFSIYLLKEGFDHLTALREDHALAADHVARALPEAAILYVLDSLPRPPWWKGYFDIQGELNQVNKGALVFLPVGDRCFALSFGHVAHNLRESSYEYDFGLRVTLNSVDPRKLKSTDTLDPGPAKRQRTQLPIESELTFFDFDRDSTILRSLTGKVREEHRDLFRHATGSSNLRIGTDVATDGLAALCERLLGIYQSEAYKTSFPEVQNISPVRDPARIEALNAKLLQAFRARNPDLNITVPEIINYSDNLYVMFAGEGIGLIYDDVYIGRYYDYLDAHEVEFTEIDVEALRRHALVLTDEDGGARDRFSIYKSLVFDTTLEDAEDDTFHLSEGDWYRIDNQYIARLRTYLDPLCAESDLPPYNHPSEGQYNEAVAAGDATVVCLDRKNISPEGQTQIEPCDLLAARDGTAKFYHVKVSTLSTQLSHLLNQGANAIQLLRLEPVAVERLEALIRQSGGGDPETLVGLVRERNYQVVFGIVTRKDPDGRSGNLPLFSRISLMRVMRSLQSMGVPARVIFVQDGTAVGEGRKKRRKKRGGGTPDEDIAAAA
jgi:uncharacterized protein (TIGR04141 family)